MHSSIVRIEGDDASGLFFFFNDTATTEIYTLSLHDALPISCYNYYIWFNFINNLQNFIWLIFFSYCSSNCLDRKSTRLNSSHANISYAVFCLKKKNKL